MGATAAQAVLDYRRADGSNQTNTSNTRTTITARATPGGQQRKAGDLAGQQVWSKAKTYFNGKATTTT